MGAALGQNVGEGDVLHGHLASSHGGTFWVNEEVVSDDGFGGLIAWQSRVYLTL